MSEKANVSSSFRQVTGIILGCGSRGTVYSSYANFYPERFNIVAIADNRLAARKKLQKRFNLDDKHVYDNWQHVAALENKIADCVLIALPDIEHYEATIAFASKGYHILLEKPMATSLEHCIRIVELCEEKNLILVVCHVLRYLPVVKKIKQLLNNNIIGYFHFAHSFVRGNWHNTKQSTFSLLAKCCHDLDLIQYWFQPSKCVQVSSFGKLMHFKKENKPVGAGDRCLHCSVEDKCPYSAKKIYLDSMTVGWPVSAICDIEDNDKYNTVRTKVINALENGNYGKCVYGNCNNDVVDQQVVLMNFDDGGTATLSMVAFTQEICVRTTRLFGTMGELKWEGRNKIIHDDFLTGDRTVYDEEENMNDAGIMSGHGGADYYAMDSFIKAVACNDRSLVGTGPQESLRSHVIAFAAETARLENRICSISEFI
ncbi:unnamed protein product [Didymodactylos carnosus]|uniref:Streptomycin biosynthesis protein StrI n=1 Tax=Didymodactylos carnosus TaxID=1234261 RepID=A0A813VI40_9BILA|nr:unnamed protein product [Didymodactylos carnosus]CAF0837803.1 unnamed protein product [Didymodactylos carnosus]CAF3533248.1 unnamed protein product [Didymodactylos carnosus]CAF3625055.1 unnamed protein product [Didymodactylos carnosus]